MRIKILLACIILGLASCGNQENTGNGADDHREEGPYKYTNEEKTTENEAEQDNTSTKRVDSLGQN